MINASECPICYEIPSPKNNPEIELCNNQHTACTNCARKLANQAIAQGMDFRLGAHVHAARRLIEQEHRGVLVQQPRERDLLLVAAGELADALIPVAAAHA